MNRAMAVYGGVIVVFCVAIWAILSLGSTLAHAAPDLEGQWNSAGIRFSIRQSGQFMHLKFDNGPDIDVIIQQAEPAVDPRSITLAGDDWNISIEGPAESGTGRFTFSPPANQQDFSGTFDCLKEDSRAVGAVPKPATEPISHAR
jgi:hypothetical protein